MELYKIKLSMKKLLLPCIMSLGSSARRIWFRGTKRYAERCDYKTIVDVESKILF